MVLDIHVLGFEGLFFLGTSLEEFRKSVNYFMGLILTIVDSEVVSKELASPPDLFKAQDICIYELSDVAVNLLV